MCTDLVNKNLGVLVSGGIGNDNEPVQLVWKLFCLINFGFNFLFSKLLPFCSQLTLGATILALTIHWLPININPILFLPLTAEFLSVWVIPLNGANIPNQRLEFVSVC